MRMFGRKSVIGGAVVVGLVLVGLAASPSAWATSTGQTGGYDISWPQCPSNFPSGPTFGVVGVNDGKPDSANSCLSGEYAWALKATYAATYAPQLYLNSANPGRAGYTFGSGPQSCTRKDVSGCAYDYGYNAGLYAFDYASQQVPGTSLASLQWWIDVESANSWQHDTTSNIDDIQGMIDGLASVGVTKTGIYTNSSSWSSITGNTATFAALPAWFPSGSTQSVADPHCDSPGPSGGPIWMVQYGSGGYDGDDLCSAYAG